MKNYNTPSNIKLNMIRILEDMLMFKGKKFRVFCIIFTLVLFFLIWFSYNNESFTNTMQISYNYPRKFIRRPANTFEEDLSNFIKPSKMTFKGEKIVHVDLKGAPLKISYYKQFFKLLVKLGSTGVLMEYEDMFPYQGSITGNISALNAYTLSDIKYINELAKNMNLKLIPLIQTFGHMEFVLKLKDWKHLREVPKYPSVICPSQDQTLILIREMIDQIIKAHPYSKLIHIGVDEVFHIGNCNKCFERMDANKWSKEKLFLHHATTVAKMVKQNYPDMRVLMWDDEFRNVRQEDLENWKIATLVEPVVWKYTRDVYSSLGSSLWEMYSKVFPKIWIASAFKGATGSDQTITDICYHLENHKSWMQVVADYSNKITFEGIIITGWQRYDHFAVLCELLPIGIPSLALSLYLIQGYIDSTLEPPEQIVDILQCENPYALLGPSLGTPKCGFPGGNILEAVLKLQQLKGELGYIKHSSVVKGWMTEYNIKHGVSNLLYLEETVENLDTYKMQLMQIESDVIANMSKVYDNYTIDEWRETFIRPVDNEIEALWEAREKFFSKDYWPRRPFPIDKTEL